jgi:hypothetical protein
MVGTKKRLATDLLALDPSLFDNLFGSFSNCLGFSLFFNCIATWHHSVHCCCVDPNMRDSAAEIPYCVGPGYLVFVDSEFILIVFTEPDAYTLFGLCHCSKKLTIALESTRKHTPVTKLTTKDAMCFLSMYNDGVCLLVMYFLLLYLELHLNLVQII